ncbi:helix-turn-helix domain-containing protein [Myxococcota bacterium]
MVNSILCRRRDELGLTNVGLARLTGLGLATVQRALSDGNARLGTLTRIADALGVDLVATERVPITRLREGQARRKARELVGLVQGSSALEAQAVGNAETEAMIERTVRDLLRGSNRALWAT